MTFDDDSGCRIYKDLEGHYNHGCGKHDLICSTVSRKAFLNSNFGTNFPDRVLYPTFGMPIALPANRKVGMEVGSASASLVGPTLGLPFCP